MRTHFIAEPVDNDVTGVLGKPDRANGNTEKNKNNKDKPDHYCSFVA